jgi:type I restriction enzyme, S subunit
MNWEKVPLGLICTIEKGVTGIQKAIEGEYPLVVTGEERKSHNEYQFDDEAVLIPLVSGTGHGHASLKRIHYQTGKFALGSILCAVIPKDKQQLSAEYLFRFLDLNKENELVERMRGMANVTLPMKEIALIEIPLPSLQEQIEFVEKYKHLETQSQTLTAELTHQRALVKQLRQQLLQDAVQGKLVSNSHDGETGSQLLKRIQTEKAQLIKEKKLKKEKELPKIKAEDVPFEVPEGWVWCRLGEITRLVTSGSRDWARYYSSNGDIFLRMGNLSKDSFNLKLDKIQYVKPPKNQEGNRTKLERGDILVSITGDVGNLGLIPNDFGEAYINQHTALIRLNNSISILFICYLLLSEIMKKQFNAPQRGMKNSFRLSDIDVLLIPLPPFSIQQKIVEKVESLMTLCDGLDASIGESVGVNEVLLGEVLREALGG